MRLKAIAGCQTFCLTSLAIFASPQPKSATTSEALRPLSHLMAMSTGSFGQPCVCCLMEGGRDGTGGSAEHHKGNSSLRHPNSQAWPGVTGIPSGQGTFTTTNRHGKQTRRKAELIVACGGCGSRPEALVVLAEELRLLLHHLVRFVPGLSVHRLVQPAELPPLVDTWAAAGSIISSSEASMWAWSVSSVLVASAVDVGTDALLYLLLPTLAVTTAIAIAAIATSSPAPAASLPPPSTTPLPLPLFPSSPLSSSSSSLSSSS